MDEELVGINQESEPNWLTVLRVFYEENLAFEFAGGPEYWISFIPNRDELDGIDIGTQIRKLKNSGLLEVKREEVYPNGYDNPSDSIPFIKISSKGIDTIHDRQLRLEQHKREINLINKQQEFEEKQQVRQNKINAAIGYLTLGILVTTAIDLVLSITTQNQNQGMITWTILSVGTLIVCWIGWKVFQSDLLSSYSAQQSH